MEGTVSRFPLNCDGCRLRERANERGSSGGMSYTMYVGFGVAKSYRQATGHLEFGKKVESIV